MEINTKARPMRLLIACLLLAACSTPEGETTNATATTTRSGTDTRTIYLVRHAETDGPSTDNPDLSATGQARAERLAGMIGKADAVYSTDLRRTQQTAAPTAARSSVSVQSYRPGGTNFITETEGTILVVGHSNTIPGLVNALTGTSEHADIDESNYGNLYVVKGGRAEVRTY